MILSKAREALEQFVVEPVLSEFENTNSEEINVDTVFEIEAQLRSVMLKIQYINPLLRKKLPDDLTFEVVAYSSSRRNFDVSLWSEEGKGTKLPEVNRRIKNAEIIPVKTCVVDQILRMQTYIEFPS